MQIEVGICCFTFLFLSGDIIKPSLHEIVVQFYLKFIYHPSKEFFRKLASIAIELVTSL